MLQKLILSKSIKEFNLKKGQTIYIKPKKQLKEMPYIATTSDEIFDLELENIKSFKDLYSFLENILKGKKFKDKYKNEILLDNNRIKSKFVRNLLDNTIFNNIVMNKFKNDDVDKLYSLLDNYL